jgi:hypothetical protein
MTVQCREQAHFLTYIFLLVVGVVSCAPGTPLPFVSSASKYRRRHARSQHSSLLISFPTGFLLKKPRAGTRERTFFRPGPLTRGSWSARNSALIEVEKWSGDLRSLGRTQITEKGVDPLGDTPDSFSILMEAGEVTVHELTGHFSSLLSGALRWVPRKGDRP